MQINSYNNTSPNPTRNNPQFSFSGSIGTIVGGYETALTPRSLGLIKKLSNYINDTWTEMRKSKAVMETPLFRTADIKGNLVTVKPVYQRYKNNILMEVENGKYIERILIDRQRPRDFSYERAVITDHGSATVQSFNGLTGRDSFIESRVNECLEKYIPKILPKNSDKITKKTLGL